MIKGKIKIKKWKTPKLVFKIFSFFLVVLYIQLIYLSIAKKVYGKDMTQFAKSRNTVKYTIKANRGTIYDKNNETLALNVSSYTLFAYLDEGRTKNSKKPLHVKDIEMTAEKLSQVLDEDKEYFLNKLKKGKENKKKQIEFGNVGRGITQLKKEEIEALELPGIDFIETKKRYYPNGDFASYIIGYARDKEITYKDENGDRITKEEITGELGIEAEYNDLLKGKDGYTEYQQDRYGYKITGTKEINKEAENGYDVYLTIDSNIQRFVESAVTDAMKKYEPEMMMLTVMDAKTGNILATTSTPSFDPNLRNIKNYENPLVTYTYEPGSTMKIYTYMCAIDNGKYNGEEMFESGNIKIGDDTVNDWNKTGWGRISYDKGFEYSSNVGIANLIQKKVNKKELRECYKKYGFGKTTGVELTREQAGKVEFNYPIEVATAGFGQGVSTTAMQQLQALTIIANDGKMLRPHIVDKIVESDTGKIYYQSKVEPSEQLVKKETVDKIKDLMYNVVNGTDNGTTGKAYKIEDFEIIGKTGTAQISERGKYLEDNYILSFAGMYPKNNPEYIIYAMTKKPNVNATVTLSDAVKDVMISISKYKQVSTVKTEKKSEFLVESYTNKNKEEIIKKLEENGIKTLVLGSGDKIIKQYPNSNTKITSQDRVILLTNSSDIEIPSFNGYSRSEVKKVLDLLSVKYHFEGYGYVYEQSISAGTKINKDTEITLKLKSRYVEDGKNE